MTTTTTTTTTTGSGRSQAKLALRCWRSKDLTWTELQRELSLTGLSHEECCELDRELEQEGR